MTVFNSTLSCFLGSKKVVDKRKKMSSYLGVKWHVEVFLIIYFYFDFFLNGKCMVYFNICLNFFTL